MTYSEKLKDPRWQKKRLEILERDEFTCRDCGSKDKTLHVHHCHYERGDPWNAHDGLLMTLCEGCHKLRGELEDVAKILLGHLLARLPNNSDEHDLLGFIESLERAVRDDYSPIVMDGTFEWISEIRLFNYACDHPEARRCYDEMDGRKAPWTKIDAALRDHEEQSSTTT
jgi:hypothetical protein